MDKNFLQGFGSGFNLAELSSNVAIYLDILRLAKEGKPNNFEEKDYSEIERLAEILNEELHNPIGNYILGNSFLRYFKRSGKIEFESVDELAMRTHLFAKELKDARRMGVERLYDLRDFCIDISREASNYYFTYYSGRRGLVA